MVWIIFGAIVVGGIAGAIWAWHRFDPNKDQHQPQAQPRPPTQQVNVAVVAVVLAVLAVLFQLPSISIDISLIFTYASDIVTLMMPLIGVGAGISFGFALVAYIIRLFRQVF